MIIHDFRRIRAGRIARPAIANSFQLAWPAIENFATLQGDSRVILQGTHGISTCWSNNSAKSHG